MTNNTQSGIKKSAFTGSSTIPSGSYLDFVVNGKNLRIKDTDFYKALSVTGVIEQEGDPLGVPVLDRQGSTNAIRNITSGFGLKAAINPHNGITLSTDFSFNESGATLVEDPSSSSADFRSLVAGDGVSISQATGTITINSLTALATSAQYFDKSSMFSSTPEQIANDVRIQNYSVGSNTGTLSETLTPSDSLILNSFMSESNETTIGLKPNYFDMLNAPQSTYLDEMEDKFLFPSNLYTYNNNYTQFIFRVILTVDHPANSANQLSTLKVSLKRKVDDSIVTSKEWSVANKAARSGFKFTRNFDTFVGDESDPYVVDGMYIEVENSLDSDTNITLVEADVRIFKL